MTPKEKAFHLHFKFYKEIIANNEKAKQCALIAANEMLNNAGFIWGRGETGESARDEYRKYWQEVRQEIEKL